MKMIPMIDKTGSCVVDVHPSSVETAKNRGYVELDKKDQPVPVLQDENVTEVEE